MSSTCWSAVHGGMWVVMIERRHGRMERNDVESDVRVSILMDDIIIVVFFMPVGTK